MSHVSFAAQPFSGAHIVKAYPGFGILGAAIPSAGDNGPSPVLDDGINSAVEYRWQIEAAPASGTVTLFSDLTFTHTGAADGTWTWQYRAFGSDGDQWVGTVSDTFGVTVQIARPVADLSNTGWAPSSGATLHPMIGETVRDDGTYIVATAVGALCEVDLTDLADPAVSTGHLPTLVLSAPGGGGITVRLRQGTTTIAAWTYHPGTTPTEYTPTLSGAEADSITDYTALRFQFEAVA